LVSPTGELYGHSNPEARLSRWVRAAAVAADRGASLLRYAFAKAVGAATPENPRKNYTGDPYWTDGLRLVMWLSGQPHHL